MGLQYSSPRFSFHDYMLRRERNARKNIAEIPMQKTDESD
jgi:hypothetical protein